MANGNIAVQEYNDHDNYCEIINGKTVMTSPRPSVYHNHVSFNISSIFRRYLRGKRCVALSDGYDVHLDEKNTFIPDAMIVCNRDIIKPDGIYGAPDLVVEVMSPSTAMRDKTVKKYAYEKAGVKEYWIVDPISKSVEVWQLRGDRYEIDCVYYVYLDYEWNVMSEKEKENARLSVKVSLYDDLYVDIREIFEPL